MPNQTVLEKRAEELEFLSYDGGLPHQCMTYEKQILDLFTGRTLETSDLCDIMTACNLVIQLCRLEHDR